MEEGYSGLHIPHRGGGGVLPRDGISDVTHECDFDMTIYDMPSEK